jgi:exopolyphosphatase/guanosine-5'-triphosphate,3'-diphosphate pyrophosphatase
VRLFISNVYENNKIITIEKASLVRIPVRLGEDVFTTGIISEKKKQNLLKTLTAFKMLMEVYKPLKYRACATDAMRGASNSKEVLKSIKDNTGIKVDVIDGMEEARIISASNNIDLGDKYKIAMYVDVGGGSTEVSVLRDHQLVASNSFEIGTIRLLNNKIDESEWERMRQWLRQFKEDNGKILLIGSGGNINKLSKLYGKENNLSYSALMQAYAHLNSFTLNERIEKLGMRPDRADVIIPAARIFLLIMKWIKSDSVYVPKIGLPDGLIHLLYKEYVKEVKSS